MQAPAYSNTVLILLKSTATQPDVRVRVRRSVVQVQSEDPGVGTVVPVAAPEKSKKGANLVCQYPKKSQRDFWDTKNRLVFS